MSSPDVSAYTNLTIYDADPSTLLQRMILNAQQLLPGWNAEGNPGAPEIAIAESLALVISELVYAVNRLPGAATQTLLQLFGITRGAGTAATATVTVTAVSAGTLIPQGTVLQVVSGSQAYQFTVNTDTTITGTSGTVNVTCTTPTAAVNGIPAGTGLTVLSQQLPLVSTVTFATAPAGGVDPESNTAWLNRGTATLQGITTALVVPAQFTKAAATTAVAAGGNLIYDADLARVNSGSSGSWKLGGGAVYGTANGDWQVSATGTWKYLGTGAAAGSQWAASEVIAVTPGTEYTLTATVDATHATVAPPTVAIFDPTVTTSYLTLSQTDGTNSTLTGTWTCPSGVTRVVVACDTNNATVTATSALTWSALNLIAVGGTVTAAYRATTVDNWDPTLNSGAGGTAEGSVTVAVMGESGVYLTDSQKSALQTALSNDAVAGLAVHVVDPTVTPVDVSCTVWQQPGFTVEQVQANVAANLAVAAPTGAGISTDNWQWGATVRRFDIVRAISTAAGVSYLASLTTPTADISLSGTAPLATLGTVTVTVEGP